MKVLANFVLGSGFAVTSVILFILAVSAKRKKPQNILMLFLSIILLIIVTVAASLHKLRYVFIFFNFFEDGARFVLGPLLYIYIKSIFNKDKKPIKSNLLHFLPFLIYVLVITIPFTISRIIGEHVFDYLSFFHGTAYLAVIKDLFWLFYVLISARFFLRFKTKMKFNYSSFKKADFRWIHKFLISCFLVALFDLVVVICRIFYIREITWDIGLVSLCFLILLTIYLGYHGLRQATIYLPDFLMDDDENQKVNSGKRNKPTISEEEQMEIKEKLVEVLLKDKPYLHQELTLNGLAELVNTTDKKLSTVLNHTLDVSFYDYINSYRVEAIKEKLQLEEYEKYSLLGVAFTCGFNSKSSFYRAFKKETGISPKTYKKGITT